MENLRCQGRLLLLEGLLLTSTCRLLWQIPKKKAYIKLIYSMWLSSKCYEVKCNKDHIHDNYGQKLDRTYSCFDDTQSVVVCLHAIM